MGYLVNRPSLCLPLWLHGQRVHRYESIPLSFITSSYAFEDAGIGEFHGGILQTRHTQPLNNNHFGHIVPFLWTLKGTASDTLGKWYISLYLRYICSVFQSHWCPTVKSTKFIWRTIFQTVHELTIETLEQLGLLYFEQQWWYHVSIVQNLYNMCRLVTRLASWNFNQSEKDSTRFQLRAYKPFVEFILGTTVDCVKIYMVFLQLLTEYPIGSFVRYFFSKLYEPLSSA